MSTRSTTTRFALLAAGWIAAAGVAAPVLSQTAFAQTDSTPSAVTAPAPTSPPAVATAPMHVHPHHAVRVAARVPTGPALSLLQEADTALQAKKFSEARDKLEQAETSLLNDRSRGEHGFAQVVSDVASARNALGNRNPEAARLAIGQAISKLNTHSI
ncbi:hypothetical protein IAI18_10560 [Acetobacteraceae bacterium H6797]|nr:hypothetical protein [Acetobacteraceae bacterium H6797]